VTPVQLVVWSDYLCPWCRVADARVQRLLAELPGRVEVTWRSFLLRPEPDPGRTLEKFVRYTRSWERPAAEPDAPPFRAWASDEGPPSHSLPPHLAAKAAATYGPEAFARLHQRLLDAYFVESRDITAPGVLGALWVEVGLPHDGLARLGDPAVLEAVVADHNAAVEHGIGGVPTAMLTENAVPIPGALPYETYRRWVERALERAGA
jgi:predicted DsbA family dithiol-disulfide isomerase